MWKPPTSNDTLVLHLQATNTTCNQITWNAGQGETKRGGSCTQNMKPSEVDWECLVSVTFYHREYGSRRLQNSRNCPGTVVLRESETGVSSLTEEGVLLDGLGYHDTSSNITLKMVSFQVFKGHNGDFIQGGGVNLKLVEAVLLTIGRLSTIIVYWVYFFIMTCSSTMNCLIYQQ